VERLFVMCANPSGPDAASPRWKSAIVRPCCGGSSRHRRPWPGDDRRTVAEAFAEEQPRLLTLPAHPFNTDLCCLFVLPRPSMFASTSTITPSLLTRYGVNLPSSHPTLWFASGRKPADRLPSPQLRPPSGCARSGASTNPAEAEAQGINSTPHGAWLRLCQRRNASGPGLRRRRVGWKPDLQLLKLLDLYGAPALGLAIPSARKGTAQILCCSCCVKRQRNFALRHP